MFLYYTVRFIKFIFSLIPFSILNLVSRLVCFILEHIVRYRFQVIRENIYRCFPQINIKEFKKLKHQTYFNLASILLEGIKGLSMSKDSILNRNQFIGSDLVNQYLNRGKSVICVCPHYNNWEWSVLATGYNFPNKSIGIYKKINNPYLEKYIKAIRTRCSMLLLNTRETRFMTEEIPKGRVILLMSDQNPSNIKDAIWVKFFNQDTACLHGLEKYSYSYDLPVVYMDQRRIGPARYKVELSLLAENTSNMNKGELTAIFMSKLEEVLKKDPAPWLWSHKRWKHMKL